MNMVPKLVATTAVGASVVSGGNQPPWFKETFEGGNKSPVRVSITTLEAAL